MEIQSVLIAKRLYWAEWNLPFRWIVIEPGEAVAARLEFHDALSSVSSIWKKRKTKDKVERDE